MVSDSETTGFFAEVDHSRVYSCEWEFTTSNGETWSEGAEGSMIEMHNLNAFDNLGEGEYLITQDVRSNSNSLSYHFDTAEEFKSNNPGLTEVTTQ